MRGGEKMGQAGWPGPIEPAGPGPFQGVSASPSIKGFLRLFKDPSPRLTQKIIRGDDVKERIEKEIREEASRDDFQRSIRVRQKRKETSEASSSLGAAARRFRHHDRLRFA